MNTSVNCFLWQISLQVDQIILKANIIKGSIVQRIIQHKTEIWSKDSVSFIFSRQGIQLKETFSKLCKNFFTKKVYYKSPFTTAIHSINYFLSGDYLYFFNRNTDNIFQIYHFLCIKGKYWYFIFIDSLKKKKNRWNIGWNWKNIAQETVVLCGWPKDCFHCCGYN